MKIRRTIRVFIRSLPDGWRLAGRGLQFASVAALTSPDYLPIGGKIIEHFGFGPENFMTRASDFLYEASAAAPHKYAAGLAALGFVWNIGSLLAEQSNPIRIPLEEDKLPPDRTHYALAATLCCAATLILGHAEHLGVSAFKNPDNAQLLNHFHEAAEIGVLGTVYTFWETVRPQRRLGTLLFRAKRLLR